jgi:DNA-binding MarR family transcriptional regulator
MHPTTLPPSSRKVLIILEDGGSMTHKDLVRSSNLAPRTVRYALKRLKDNDLIVEKFNFKDARQIIYQYKPPQAAEAA